MKSHRAAAASGVVVFMIVVLGAMLAGSGRHDVIAAEAVAGPARLVGPLRYSTALANWAGKVPEHPEGHHMVVRSLRVVPYDPAQK